MHSLLRLISRYLLLIMLATVFSPSFGWEAAQAMAEHDHAVMVDDATVHHAVHDDAPCAGDGCSEQAGTPCAESQHHCCPGHQLGHLSCGIAAAPPLDLPLVAKMTRRELDSRFSTRVPEGLERPPRASSG